MALSKRFRLRKLLRRLRKKIVRENFRLRFRKLQNLDSKRKRGNIKMQQEKNRIDRIFRKPEFSKLDKTSKKIVISFCDNVEFLLQEVFCVRNTCDCASEFK